MRSLRHRKYPIKRHGSVSRTAGEIVRILYLQATRFVYAIIETEKGSPCVISAAFRNLMFVFFFLFFFFFSLWWLGTTVHVCLVRTYSGTTTRYLYIHIRQVGTISSKNNFNLKKLI